MLSRHRRDERCSHFEYRRQLRVGWRIESESDVAAAFPYGCDDTVRTGDRDNEVDPGIPTAEPRDHLREKMRHQRLNGIDVDGAAPQSLESVDFRPHLVDL